MKIIYKTRATASGGRSGRSQLDDGSLGFDLAMPGSGKVGANPEQLFAIGYAACFDSALLRCTMRVLIALITNGATHASKSASYCADFTFGWRTAGA